MRQTFLGYYRPTEPEFASLWANALFVVDANVLLSIYGYSSAARKTLLDLLDAVADRLWIPYQFAMEYHRNRAKAILEQANNYKDVATNVKGILDNYLKAQARHPFVSKKSFVSLELIHRELEKGYKQHMALLSKDPYAERLTNLFQGKVGPKPSETELQDLYKEASSRYERSTPPGYIDVGKKPEPEAFGDFIGWSQILDHGVIQSKSVIFLTDDLKEDWWYIYQKNRMGPRPELIAEYLSICNAQFYMYSVEQFMRYAPRHLRLRRNIAPAVVQEVRERSEARNTDNPDIVQKPSVTERAKQIMSVDSNLVPLSAPEKPETLPLVGKADTKKSNPAL